MVKSSSRSLTATGVGFYTGPGFVTRHIAWTNKNASLVSLDVVEDATIAEMRADVRHDLSSNLRDRALLNVATGSKLRGCELIKLTVSDLVKDDRFQKRVSMIQSKPIGLFNLNCRKTRE